MGKGDKIVKSILEKIYRKIKFHSNNLMKQGIFKVVITSCQCIVITCTKVAPLKL